MHKQSGTIRVGRYTIPYRVYGNPNSLALPIVCVNGAQQTMAAWRSFVSRFNNSFPVVLFDLPGQGRAQCHDGPEAATLDEQCAVLEAVVATVAPSGRAHLIAASWGGILAAAFAARQPERVDRLLLGSFGLRANTHLMRIMDQGMRLIESGEASRCGDLIIEGFAAQVSAHLQQQIVAQFRSMPPAHLRAFYAHITWCSQAVVIDSVDFTRITAQTLLVIGEEDPIINRSDAHEVNTLIPNCELVIVPQAGHFLHFDNPAILALYEPFFLTQKLRTTALPYPQFMG